MLEGTLVAITLYDVAEVISLDSLRAHIADRVRPSAVPLASFYRQPLIERLPPIEFPSGNIIDAEIKFYDFGNISVSFSRPFSGTWQDLVETASRWIGSAEFEKRSRELVQERVQRHADCIDKPFSRWIDEDYFVFRIDPIDGDVLREHGGDIAQIVRGENQSLSSAERSEVLQSAISYYPKDLAVIGWNAAFVMDTESGAATSLQLLEYANSQLLEFRHYDGLLSAELERVYRLLAGRIGFVDRWTMARNASRMQGVLLEVTELTERAENAIKFLSDMYSARFYRLASIRIGVPDYRRLVAAKLETAQDRYEYMLDRFNQTRALFLEVTVIVILLIELASVLLGHR
ncbi:MAG: hypothetical protein JOZ43_05295 [Acidobacteriales bacterium]|nr:hypothetical protein [Terriglobales bacterium]